MKERIQKVLSEQGICSRRAAEQKIAAGKVKINGHPAKIGDKIDYKDVVSIDGERVYFERKTEKLCYALYKPRGFVTTLADELDRKCVSDLMAEVGVRLFPIGRLDKDSEGLILMTNDGALANMLMHPSRKVGKLYRVSVSPAITEEQLIALSSGVVLDDGYKTQPAVIRTISADNEHTSLEFTLYEGKNRQIRRMCEAVGLRVNRLKRMAIGPIKLDRLAPGKYRLLSKTETTALWNSAGGQ